MEIDPDGLLVEGDGGASIGELGDGHQVVAKFRDVVHVGKPSLHSFGGVDLSAECSDSFYRLRVVVSHENSAIGCVVSFVGVVLVMCEVHPLSTTIDHVLSSLSVPSLAMRQKSGSLSVITLTWCCCLG